ncbi:MAG: epoxyqueuosine reductase [Syntrophaceae bacterium]|nr:epoxyqueuosine reductase [Syntrophaceae bacterium]
MKEERKTKDPAKWVEGIIKDFINTSPENTLKNPANDKAWADPLVGFSAGNDSLYQAYKEEYVGPFHWTPLELFRQAFSASKAEAEELSVISWILPQMERTKADLRKETIYPSESWTRARIFGEEANVKLRKHVVNSLQAAGIEAVAPMLFPEWGTRLSARFGFASTWSERHAAHAAGLGTFGLCDGLITPRGKAMRAGSVVARVQIPPTPRPYKDHRAYCLFYSNGTCGKCIDRCPIRAISQSGHDKVKCKSFLDMTRNYVLSHHGFEGYGCGFCQAGVPCESRIPGPEEGK